jgi:hypothetical protein
MKILKPTDKVKKVESIFLAGTIDMGNSIDWQEQVTHFIEDFTELHDVTIYNPRRDDWDSSWKQTIDDPQFNHQVTWELTCLEKADLVVMYFGSNSKSPISLLELGLFKHKVLCYCPDDFYRKGNVDMVGDRYGFPIYNDLTKFLLELENRLSQVV